MKRYLLGLLFASGFLATSCSDESVSAPVDEQELITHVRMLLVDTSASGDTIVTSFADPDGAGGLAPVIRGCTLLRGHAYRGSLELWDSSKSPAFNVAAEIANRKNEHQFFIVPNATLSALTVVATDRDDHDLPVGLSFNVNVGAAAAPQAGTLRLTLSHYGGRAKDGVTKSIDTDVEIDVPITLD